MVTNILSDIHHTLQVKTFRWHHFYKKLLKWQTEILQTESFVSALILICALGLITKRPRGQISCSRLPFTR